MIVGLLALVVGSLAVYKIASEYDHNGGLWLLAAMIGSGAAYWLSVRWAWGSEYGVVTALVPLVSVLTVFAALAVLAIRVPPLRFFSRAMAWSMHLMDLDTEAETQCELRVTNVGLEITHATHTTIPFNDVTSVERDGECLVIHWRDGGTVKLQRLLPGGCRSRSLRIHVVDGIVAAFDAKTGRAELPAARLMAG